MQNRHLDIRIQCLIFYFLANFPRVIIAYFLSLRPRFIFCKQKSFCHPAPNTVPNWHPKSLYPINRVPTRYHLHSILLQATLPLKKQNPTYLLQSPLPALVWILALHQFLVLHLEKQLFPQNNRLCPPTQPLQPHLQTP